MRAGERLLPVGQTDPFDGVVAVVHFVAGFKHNAEPPAAKALHGLKVGQVPEERTLWLLLCKKKNHTSVSCG